ncbi:MAG: hypothetical protein JWM93_2920 [Frankiales bacterium]|nr:hypothetical protein [Frankiales bacterium]
MRIPTRAGKRPLLLSAILLLLAPATGRAAGEVALRPAGGAAGSSIVLDASGFPVSKRVVIGVTGARARTVKTSSTGTFRRRITAPDRKGWVRIVSRSGRSRVVNRFLVTDRSGANGVVEVASTRGLRLRISPTKLFPGSTLRVQGAGFGRSKKLKLSAFGATRTINTKRNGTFDATLVVPATASAGSSRLVVSRGGLRFSVKLSLSPRAVTPVEQPPPAPAPGPVKTPPTVNRNPVVPTSVTVGQTITFETTAQFDGTAPITTSVQWQRCGEACVNVGTGSSYPVAQGDVGYVVQAVVTATDAAGAAVSAPSNRSDPVKPQVVANGVVALWHMNDTRTTMVDSVGGHNGTLRNVQTGLAGSIGTAFGFNGSNSYTFVPQSDSLSAVGRAVTISIRMKVTPGDRPNAATEQDWDLMRSAGEYYDGDEYKVEYNPDATVLCAFKGNAGYAEVFSSAAKPLDDGAWHTIECIKTATQVNTVVDGVKTSATVTVGSIVITKGLLFGAHPAISGASGASEWFKGQLDEASIVFW